MRIDCISGEHAAAFHHTAIKFFKASLFKDYDKQILHKVVCGVCLIHVVVLSSIILELDKNKICITDYQSKCES